MFRFGRAKQHDDPAIERRAKRKRDLPKKRVKPAMSAAEAGRQRKAARDALSKARSQKASWGTKVRLARAYRDADEAWRKASGTQSKNPRRWER